MLYRGAKSRVGDQRWCPNSALLGVFGVGLSLNLRGQEKRVLFFGGHLPTHDFFEAMHDFFWGQAFLVIERGIHRASSANHQIAQETDPRRGTAEGCVLDPSSLPQETCCS